MNKLKNITILLCVSIWPLSFIVKNGLLEFLRYSLLPVALAIAFVVYKKSSPKAIIIALAIPLFILTSSYKNTIFNFDYQAQQKILRDTKLYKNIFLARLFHNKARIVIDKLNDNFFAMTDPNNYFFGFAPRQLVGNQNLVKFPFLALPFVLYGIWKGDKNKKFILISFAVSIFFLSLFSNFDKFDLILWFPISLSFVNGVKRTNSKVLNILFIIFSIPEILSIFIK